MNFESHYELAGKHSFLSGSQYHWINYNAEKLKQVYINKQKMAEGTELHDLAERLIMRRIKLHPLKKAFNLFVNDAIGFNMQPEQVLYYSDNCFGTADAILFKDNLLRIHDLKTGASKPSFHQLEIYAAIFCLEYSFEPENIEMEMRLYQGNGYTIHIPEPSDIRSIMNKIVEFDKVIEATKLEY